MQDSNPKALLNAGEFIDDNGEFTLQVGDEVKVALDAVEDGFGATKLSREKAKRAETWMVLEEAFEKMSLLLASSMVRLKADSRLT